MSQPQNTQENKEPVYGDDKIPGIALFTLVLCGIGVILLVAMGVKEFFLWYSR